MLKWTYLIEGVFRMTTYNILFGTYTKRVSQGIYEATLDTDTKTFSEAKLIAEATNPTYLAQSQANLIYAVNSIDGEGGLTTFDGEVRPLKALSHNLSEGSAPAYVGIDEDRQLVFAGYYHRGTVESYRIVADGTLELVDTFQNTGSGPRPEQQSSHIHFSGLTPDNKLVAVDLGTDEVITFDVATTGELTEVARYQAEAGFGPRHIRFSPDGKHAYLLGELSSILSVLDYSDGRFTHVQSVSTIPDDWDAHNGTAAIRVSSDGRFIYTSNRGHNSLAVFAVSQDGASVERIQLISTEGEFPRDFNWTPDQSFVVAANQDTDNVALYERDAESGLLTLISSDLVVPEAIRVTFEA